MSEAFVAQCKRNIDLCSIAVHGHVSGSGRSYAEEKKAISSGLAKEVYDRIKSSGEYVVQYNPRYLQYCAEQGNSPERQLEIDGNMTNFVVWAGN